MSSQRWQREMHHLFHDVLSLLRHREAVRRMREDPALVQRALATLRRWKLTVDPRSLPLLLEWGRILEEQDWESALQETERGDQIRQASPMVTVLPPDVRMEILRKWRELYGQFAEESGFRAGRPKREKTSALVLAAQTASTSYTHKLPPSEVEAALMSGVVQDSWSPHIRCLLEEAPESLLLNVVEELHAKSGEPMDAIWKRMHAMAQEMGCRHDRQDFWDAPAAGKVALKRFGFMKGRLQPPDDLDAPMEDVIRDFHERGDRAAAELKRTEVSYSVEEVLQKMRRMTEERRRQLGLQRKEDDPTL